MLVACLALLSIAAEPAGARFDNRDASKSVKTAWRYWHSLVPHQFEKSAYGCDRGAVEARWVRDLGAAMATAALGGCSDRPPWILLERGTVRHLSDVWACGVVVHEYGHLLGYGHVGEGILLMSGATFAGDARRGAPPGSAHGGAATACSESAADDA